MYRFGNPLVDDWEGKVNAWPLDEGLIDYVDGSFGSESEDNEFCTANIIANPSATINGQAIDATVITPELLSSELHEAGGIESNVATGYHAIEFFLWGQDLNGGNAGAGERMQLGLMLHDPEEEHDCFADNKSASHFYDGLGIQNVFSGQYQRVTGETVSGPSLQSLLKTKDSALADELEVDLQASVDKLQVLLTSQVDGQAYDQLIAEGNTEGNTLVQEAIDALIAHTRNMERAVTALGVAGIQFEGSDSVDDPSSVFQ